MAGSLWGVGTLCLASWLLAALWLDLRFRRIPNSLVLSGLAVAVVLHVGLLLTGRPSLAGASLWAPCLGAVVGAALLLPVYLRAGMGAGDVKLMAVAGAFLGPVVTTSAALWAMVAGGMQAAAWWGWHRWVIRNVAPGMPFAPAIVAGVVWAMYRTVSWPA